MYWIGIDVELINRFGSRSRAMDRAGPVQTIDAMALRARDNPLCLQHGQIIFKTALVLFGLHL